MSPNGIHRRIDALEERGRQRRPPRSSEAQERMKRHLARLAAWRRGELSEEEAAAVEAETAAVQDRLAQQRGEGTS